MPRQAEVASPYESLFNLAGAIARLRRRSHVAGAGTINEPNGLARLSAFIS